MSIEFVCPTCSGTLRVDDASAGRVIRCGACLTTLRVPEISTESNPEPKPTSAPTAADPPAAPPSPFESEIAPAAAVPVARPRPRERDERDSDDRPRRRRGRPPPAPGRSALFWLGLVGGLFLLITLGCCGGLYVAVPGANWRTHESAKGGYKVDLPAPARPDMDKIAGGPQDPDMTVEGTILFRSFEEYAVVYRAMPNDRGLSDKEILDEMVRAMKSEGEVEAVLSQKDITVNGCPAREVEFSAKGGGYYGARLILADGRVYVLVGGGAFTKPGNENVRRFLDSFEITDPKLKASGERKLAAAKRAEEQQRAWKEQQEQARIAQEKAEAEQRRIAEEKRRTEDAAQERVRLKNEAFLAGGRYDGPAIPATEQTNNVRVFSFEEQRPVGGNPVVSGPGVRGKAAYAAPIQWLAEIGERGDIFETRIRDQAIGQQRGYTLSGWVRVRDNPFLVFLIVDNRFGPEVVVTLDKKQLFAWVKPREFGAPARELKHPWDGDEKWHHVALVSDRFGKQRTRLYLDGVLVTSHTDAAPVPLGSLRCGWALPKDDYRTPRSLAPYLYPPGTPEPGKGELIGALDECAVFGRPLSDDEVAALAGRKPLPTAPAPRAVPERPVAPAPRPVERE